MIAAPAGPAPAGAADPAAAPPAVRSLLVVDDEDTVCFGIRAYFTAHGLDVECTATLAGAVECLERRSYDAVVSDLRLTGSDAAEGLELLRHVRARSATLPFVLLTGFRSEGAAAEAERYQVSAILTKPRPLAELAKVVTDLLA